jgi:biopolymer transport protein ExbB/TolQ
MLNNSPKKLIWGLIWWTGLLVAGFYAAYHYGAIQALIPFVPFVLSTVGFIALVFLFTLVFHVFRTTPGLDRERHAFMVYRNHMDRDDLSDNEKVADLFDGVVFKNGLEYTAVAKFMARMVRSKTKNARYPIQLGAFSGHLASGLQRSIAPIANNGALLVTLGLLGTFLGVAVGLQNIDLSSVNGTDIQAGLSIIGTVLSSVGVAVLTSLTGMAGNIVLRRFHDKYEVEIESLADKIEGITLTDFEPIVNDDERLAEVQKILEDRKAANTTDVG